MSDFGERIRRRRKELKLSQRELCRRCGLSASFLCDVELGKRHVGSDSLLSLAGALGVSLDWLMTGSGAEPAAGGVSPPEPPLSLPSSLVRFATDHAVTFSAALCLYRLAQTVERHRPREKWAGLEGFDWVKLYDAVKEWL